MDTITLVRSATRGLLKAADGRLADELRAVLSSGDDYADAAKPAIDWDDATSREQRGRTRRRGEHGPIAVLAKAAGRAAISEDYDQGRRP
jgi:hypothetical protein